jgi:succinyl-diaminopimelate desuccinylase
VFESGVEDVLRRIDREELARLTEDLVRIPSVYRPEEQGGNENEVARFVADYLKNAGLRVRIEEVTPGRTNVWAVWEGSRPGKTLLFEAHTDVVTEGSADAWEHPPFEAERDARRIYGRGCATPRGTWPRPWWRWTR